MPVACPRHRRRAGQGWTHEELTERASAGGDRVRQPDVSRLGRGNARLPQRGRLQRIAAALDLPLGELLVLSGWCGAAEAFPPGGGPGALASRRNVPKADDESATVGALVALLEGEGYGVRRAGEGPPALAEVQRSAPAVVVADAVRPGIDGVALADRLRRPLDPIPVVVLGNGPNDPTRAGIPSVPRPLALPALRVAQAAVLAANPGASGSGRSLP